MIILLPPAESMVDVGTLCSTFILYQIRKFLVRYIRTLNADVRNRVEIGLGSIAVKKFWNRPTVFWYFLAPVYNFLS